MTRSEEGQDLFLMCSKFGRVFEPCGVLCMYRERLAPHLEFRIVKNFVLLVTTWPILTFGGIFFLFDPVECADVKYLWAKASSGVILSAGFFVSIDMIRFCTTLGYITKLSPCWWNLTFLISSNTAYLFLFLKGSVPHAK